LNWITGGCAFRIRCDFKKRQRCTLNFVVPDCRKQSFALGKFAAENDWVRFIPNQLVKEDIFLEKRRKISPSRSFRQRRKLK